MSNASANEQLMLELVNRARLDPLGEAARFGIDLNQDLAPGTISGAPKPPVAMNNLLANAARGHSQWMINTDTFSHTGAGGSDPGARMTAAGYQFTGSWTWGENIAWQGTTGAVDLTAFIIAEHRGLFLSAGHRENTLNATFREIGIGQSGGVFTQSGTNYNASMVTQDYAKTGSNFFVLGVAYNDANGDEVYTVGEARPSVHMAVQLSGGGALLSADGGSSGGYELGVAAGTYNISFSGGGLPGSMTVQAVLAQNLKLDVVNGDTIKTSDDITLEAGASKAVALGVDSIAITGNDLANVLTGNAGVNVLNGQGGDDVIAGGPGADQLDGGTGTDMASYASSLAAVDIRLNSGSFTGGDAAGDTLISIEGVIGSAFGDTFLGSVGDNRLDCGAGNDDVWANHGNDTVLGGAGNDRLFGQWGDDTIEGGPGADRVDGDVGIDTASYASSSAAVDIRLNSGSFTGGDAAGDVLLGIENVFGSAFDDTFLGSVGDNRLDCGAGNDDVWANHGNDTLIGGAGNDRLFGQWGDDTIEGGPGADQVNGDVGIDTASYASSSAAVDIRLSTGSYTGGDAGGDVLVGIENVIGSAFGDTFLGSVADNRLDCGAGNDDVWANHGNDTVLGGAGNDRLFGQWGNDTISGGTGNDLLEGGTDDDLFIFAFGDGLDRITDFSAGGTIDEIRLSGFSDATNFAALMTTGHDFGTYCAFDFASGDQLRLDGVLLANLNSGDFIFS
jgi:Ca2+-binding RTX toxin-like protein